MLTQGNMPDGLIAPPKGCSRSKTTQFAFRFRNEADADVIAKLMSVAAKTDYVRGLVRRDVRGEK